MRSTILTLTLAITAAASADLYTLNFSGESRLGGSLSGQFTLTFDEPLYSLPEGSYQDGFLEGTIETESGSYTAFGFAIEEEYEGESLFILLGTMESQDLEQRDFFIELFPFAGSLPPGEPSGFAVLDDEDFYLSEWSITAVPAPGALALIGLAGLGRRRRT